MPRTVLCLIVVNIFTLPAAAEPVDFNRDVRPILSKCFSCHGPDGSKRATRMRLDQRDAALRPLASGNAAIVPGAPEKSELFLRVTATDEAERMPPRETGIRLTPEQIAVLRRWIVEGAVYAEHWAFVKPARPALPPVHDRNWPRNGLDVFVLARMEQAGLRPNPEADRFTLLRRASLDLRGLPPTPAEVDAFAADSSPDAYEKAVERFLADPAFGERWARLWLDLARYADSAGYGSDPLRPNLWPWRDWVIDAFNRNLPYDRFTVEQIAGDLLPNATQEQRIATAFHRNTMTNTEGGTDDEEFRVAAVKDRVDTTAQVWMGLTLGCAKCHSHKYDPFSQTDYYRFFAIFNQTTDADRPDEAPTIPVPTAAELEQQRRLDARLADLERQLTSPSPERVASLVLARTPLWLTPALPLVVEKARLIQARPKPVQVPVMVELPPEQRRVTRLLKKGNFLDPGEVVQPGVPTSLHPLPPGAAADRLGLAHWLIAPDNPLTARVAVNRFWAQLFGTGLVETEEDFGTQGEMPSHPELLDWLAIEFVAPSRFFSDPEGNGRAARSWDVKALLRLLVTSATYRQASRVTPEKLAKDPRNRLLSRGPRHRLEAEMVRDQALALSSLLSRKIGGPSVYPYQPPGLWQAAFNGERTWATSVGIDRYRRGLYTFWRRTVPYPSMAAFDAPSREICAIRRAHTNTPLQAFVTLNDPVYVEAAQALARRIVREGGSSARERARYGLRLCLCRPPQEQQVQHLLKLFQSELEHYRKDAKAALALATEPLGPLPPDMDAAELAAWTVVANVLLNLDGVLTKG